MDLKKVFLKDSCPTSIGGQAIMEGIMMRSPERTAIGIRLPDGRIFMKTEPSRMQPPRSTARSHRDLEEARNTFSPKPPYKDTFISDFWPPTL